MTRTYTTPLAFKAALEARIAERSRAAGRTMNRVRQLLVMERFLVRVFDRLDGVVLKGGLVMELRLERARMTRDVDLRVTDEAGLLDRLRDAARLSLVTTSPSRSSGTRTTRPSRPTVCATRASGSA